MTVVELPSDAVELMFSIPSSVCTAASTRWVIWFSTSVGAAPGCEMLTIAIGNSMSGISCTCIRPKLTTPARARPRNARIGTIGLRIDHAEIWLKFIVRVCLFLDHRPDRVTLGKEAPGAQHHPFRTVQTGGNGDAV